MSAAPVQQGNQAPHLPPLAVGRAGVYIPVIMSLRTRKFIGVVACVSFLIIYCLIAMAVGVAALVERPLWVQLPGFAVLGFAWLPVVMKIIRWMSEPADASNG